jgi:Fe-S-cluster-containing hydrogenase component 2
MFVINNSKCTYCLKCVNDCFVQAIKVEDKQIVINNTGCIKCGHCIAICPVNAVSTTEYNMNEVINYDSDKFDINPDNLLNFIKFRRTIRNYSMQTVEKEKIKKIIEAGRYTQTGSNAQDVNYTVVESDWSKFKELSYHGLRLMSEKILDKKANYPKHKKIYALMWKKMINAYNKDSNNDKLFFNAPIAIIVSAKSVVNATLASSNMELMINSLGLGTLFSGFFIMAAQANPEIREFLKIDQEHEIATCMLVGYPDVRYLRTVPRKKASITWL